MSNHLRAEALLIQSLRALALVPNHHVLGAAELHGKDVAMQPVPALHVIHWDELPVSAPGELPVQMIEQQWLVVVCVRNVRERTGDAARDAVGPLIDGVLRGLIGHRLANDLAPLKLMHGPRRAYEGGFLYFPLLFSTLFAVGG